MYYRINCCTVNIFYTDITVVINASKVTKFILNTIAKEDFSVILNPLLFTIV